MWRCALVDCLNPQQEVHRLLVLDAWRGVASTHTAGRSPRLPATFDSQMVGTDPRGDRALLRSQSPRQNTVASFVKDAKTALSELKFQFDAGEVGESSLDCHCTEWCLEHVPNKDHCCAALFSRRGSGRIRFVWNIPYLKGNGLRTMPINEKPFVSLQCIRYSGMLIHKGVPFETVIAGKGWCYGGQP
jgi:hypothetical protein